MDSATTGGAETAPLAASLRIACLVPSATDICVALGLADSIVGVTHECDRPGILSASTTSGNDVNINNIRVLTRDGINPDSTYYISQAEIHAKVQEQVDSCSRNEEVPSLYPIQKEELKAAAPTVILTQDLCNVCAPSSANVQDLLDEQEESNVKVVSLSPHSLADVAENMLTVATACGIPERGVAVKEAFLGNLRLLQETIERARDAPTTKIPRIFLLEWLDPPFDGGHWIPGMMRYAGCEPAVEKTTEKSVPMTWVDVQTADADVIVVACCGFDLPRNISDAKKKRNYLSTLRPTKENRLYATDGDRYFAKPGPNVLLGTVIIALCAYEHHPSVVQAIRAL
jgi:iron complex transport system substrate-binding protein